MSYIMIKSKLPEDEIILKYTVKKQSANAISKELGCSHATILNILKSNDIPRRTTTEHFRGRKRSPEECKKLAESKMGEKNPNYGKHIVPPSNAGRSHSSETRLKISMAKRGCNNPNYGKRTHNYGKQLTPEWKHNISLNRRGKLAGDKNPRWMGGKSFDPYCPKFDRYLKEFVRDAYNRKCFLCGEAEHRDKHSVHHIDYNKNDICNGKVWPLIPLCRSCHTKTNFKRWYWFDLLINYWAFNPNIILDNELVGVVYEGYRNNMSDL